MGREEKKGRGDEQKRKRSGKNGKLSAMEENWMIGGEVCYYCYSYGLLLLFY
jgi:hypothetical protein